MKIYKREHKSGAASWWLDFTVNGKRYRRPTGAASRKTAQEIADRIAVAIASGTWTDAPIETPAAVTFTKAADEYVRDRIGSRGKQARSYYTLTAGGIWRAMFKARTLESITAQEIDDAARSWAKRKTPAATIANRLAQLSGLLSWACKAPRSWITDNPARKVERPTIDNARTNWLRPAEVAAVVAACPDWLAPIVAFAARTGMRRGEIVRLTRADVQRDAQGRSFVVVQRTKNSRPYAWPLDGEALRIVEERVAACRFDGDLLFPGPRGGNAETSIKAAFPAAVVAAGLTYGGRSKEGISFHSLRKTMASLALNAGVSSEIIQRLGNWKSAAMLKRYAHLGDEGLRDAATRIDNLLGFAPRHAGGTQRNDAARDAAR